MQLRKAIKPNSEIKVLEMKKLIFCSLAAFMMLASCGGGEDTTDETTDNDTLADVDYTGMSEMSLADHGLDLCIMLPEVQSNTGASIEPSIEHIDGDYLWHVKIGPRFHLVVEDFGKEKNKVAGEKKRLDGLTSIFTVEYIVDEANLIMYKRSLHEGQGGNTTYHCYGETTIGGYTYVLRSQQDGNLKPIIDDMVKTIRSSKECGDPAA